MGGAAALVPLQDPRFVWFFAARLVSTAGSVMAPVAITFAVLAMHESAAALGLVLAARSVPLVLFLLVGGVVADRFSRSGVLVVSHLGSALTQGAAAYLVITGTAQLSQLVVLEALNGVLTAFTMPAILGLVPQVVPRGHLQQANALLAFSRSGLAVLGPSLSALIVVTLGPGWALLADAASWLLAGLFMLKVKVAATVGGPHESMLTELRGGWGVFTQSTWLWVVVLACGILNGIHAGAWATLGPVIALRAPDLGERGWGLALSAEAVGLLALTFVMMRCRLRRPLLVGMLSMLALSLPLFVLALSPRLAPLLLTSFVAGGGVQVFMIAWQTAIHEHVPERFMSRVSAYDSLGSFAAIPLGQLAVGPLVASDGIEHVMLAAAVLFVCVVVATLMVPSVRNLPQLGGRPDSAPEAT